jgi:inhibitor of cysteine peptidase
MKTILFFLISGILLVTGCASSNSGAASTDAGKTIQVKVGQEFTIALKANPTTGYDWECVNLYEWIQPLEKTYQADNPGLVGSGGTDTFAFKAHGKGNAVLVFTYKRSWETTIADQKSFSIEVS